MELIVGRTAAATEYWSNPGRPDWRANSHWRESQDPGWRSSWSAIGEQHLAMYERFARACDLSSPARILEWGVGGGANAVHFAPLCEAFVAVDIAKPSLVEALAQIERSCPTPVEAVQVSLGDQASAVAHLSGSVDLFICFYVLELVPTAAHAHEIVRIAHRLLRPGGAAIFQAKYRRSDPKAAWRRTFANDLANSYIVSIDSFWELLVETGFDARYVEVVPRTRFDRNYAYFFATKAPRT